MKPTKLGRHLGPLRLVAGTVVAAALALGSTIASADVFVVTYENPGVESASSVVVSNANVLGTENFNSRSTGTYGFTTDFGTSNVITGNYSATTTIRAADLFGGAGANGSNFASTDSSAGYTLTLSANGIPGVNYFGFWLSALDAGNQLAFYRGGVQVGTYAPSDLLNALGSCPSVSNPYCGNPNSGFLGQDGWEPFAFVNFVDTSGYFDQVKFYESPTVGGYESDNHTVAYCGSAEACITGHSLTVPEPETYAMLLAGLGLLGFMVRRRKQKLSV